MEIEQSSPLSVINQKVVFAYIFCDTTAEIKTKLSSDTALGFIYPI